MGDARFFVESSPSADRGFDATAEQTLQLRLEAPTPDVYRAQYSIAAPGDPDAPLASKDAPVIALNPADGIASPPAGIVTVTMPTGVHSYALRCRVNDGVEAATGKAIPEWTTERIISIRSPLGLRKIIPGEGTQYSARGWADAQNEEVDAAGASGGGLVEVTSIALDLTKADGDLPYRQFNATGVGGTEFPTGPVFQLRPITVIHVELSPGGDSTSFHPTLFFGVTGVGVGWTIYLLINGTGSTSLAVKNIGDGAQPLAEIDPDQYSVTNGAGWTKKRAHQFTFMGPGSSIGGYGWQKVTPYGSP